MVLYKSLTLFVFLFLIQAKNIHSLREISPQIKVESSEEIEHCRELSTKTEQYATFFPLDDFQNDKLEDELFRYKFYVKGDSEIHILFTETDSVIDGADCLEFVLKSPYTLASTLTIKFGGVESANSFEVVPVNITTPMPVLVTVRKDGEVQMFVDNEAHPLLRYSGVFFNPKFISFSSPFAYFYFDCGNQLLSETSKNELDINDEHALPVVYVSFKISDIKNSSNYYSSTIQIGLNINLTIFNIKDKLPIASGHSKMTYKMPKLKYFYRQKPLNRSPPRYAVSLDFEDKLTASANDDLQVGCVTDGITNCLTSLAFGLTDDRFHLTYYPYGQLLPESLADFGDVKVYQAPNLARLGSFPLGMDIEMKFKININQ